MGPIIFGISAFVAGLATNFFVLEENNSFRRLAVAYVCGVVAGMAVAAIPVVAALGYFDFDARGVIGAILGPIAVFLSHRRSKVKKRPPGDLRNNSNNPMT